LKEGRGAGITWRSGVILAVAVRSSTLDNSARSAALDGILTSAVWVAFCCPHAATNSAHAVTEISCRFMGKILCVIVVSGTFRFMPRSPALMGWSFASGTLRFHHVALTAQTIPNALVFIAERFVRSDKDAECAADDRTNDNTFEPAACRRAVDRAF
jgi:hypothetical protein